MTCSRIRLKPTIKKIVITDRRGTDIFKITVKGLVDSEVRNMTAKIMALLEDKGYEPKLDIQLLKTSNSNPNPPL